MPVITANNKAAFIVKVKEALKQKYKSGDMVTFQFGEENGVQPKNIKIAIEELGKEGYVLTFELQTNFGPKAGAR